MKRALGLLTLAIPLLTLADNPAPTPLPTVAVRVVQETLDANHSSLRQALGAFYAQAVRCFERYPKQMRSSSQQFPACVKQAAAFHARAFPSLPPAGLKFPDARTGQWAGPSRELSDEVEPHPFQIYAMRKLSASLKAHTGGSYSSIDLANELVLSDYACTRSAARGELPEGWSYPYCLYASALSNVERLIQIHGLPGTKQDGSDLAHFAYLERAPRPAATFMSLGRYYPGMKNPGGSGGPVVGSSRNHNIVALKEPDIYRPSGHKLEDRVANKVLNDNLFGKDPFPH